MNGALFDGANYIEYRFGDDMIDIPSFKILQPRYSMLLKFIAL